MRATSGKAVPWWGWAFWLITVVAGIISYPHLPHMVAIHFDAAGNPNGYSTRLVAVTLGPGLMLLILLLWHVIWRIDPKRAGYASFWPTYRLLGGVFLVFLGLMHLWLLGRALGVGVASVRLLESAVGVFLMVISNALPRIQPNWWLGIRTPWTLTSEVSWRKTHRLGGHLGVVAGALTALLSWLLPTQFLAWGVLTPILLWSVVTAAASYWYAKTR